jgi:hypothetical protein
MEISHQRYGLTIPWHLLSKTLSVKELWTMPWWISKLGHLSTPFGSGEDTQTTKASSPQSLSTAPKGFDGYPSRCCLISELFVVAGLDTYQLFLLLERIRRPQKQVVRSHSQQRQKDFKVGPAGAVIFMM